MITESYRLRLRLDDETRARKDLQVQAFWDNFGKKHPTHVGHQILEVRIRLHRDLATLVCSCDELFEVTGMELCAAGISFRIGA